MNIMTLGMWVDYIIEWNKLHNNSENTKVEKKEEIRRATQADFDMFLR